MRVFFITYFVFLSIGCAAQRPLKPGSFSVSTRSVIITESSSPDKKGLFGVRFPDKYDKGFPKSKVDAFRVRKEDIHFSEEQVREIVAKTFRSKIKNVGHSMVIIAVNIKFEQDGRVASIIYSVSDKFAVVTIEDLATIDKELREDLKATFSGKDYLDHQIISYPIIRIDLCE
ncbi:hypothetical protein [Pedobacter sp. SYP-B3415]|uniref:hypothetical protein n=1 Tax=Pedobacter sp. SYP-B3415 TaxID=2496641 RepID=UPI00101CF1B1|nr:hypothetical protein [Pedobacter sp. SYP-B3415]